MVFDASLFNSLHYKVRIKGKVEPLAVATSPIHWHNSYWKGSLRVTLDYGWPTYFTYMSKWAYLEFPFVSVLVTHEYTNSDIEPWWVRIRLNIFSSTDQPSSLHVCTYVYMKYYLVLIFLVALVFYYRELQQLSYFYEPCISISV